MEQEIEKITAVIEEQNKLLFKMSKTIVEQNNRICFLATEIAKLKERK